MDTEKETCMHAWHTIIGPMMSLRTYEYSHVPIYRHTVCIYSMQWVSWLRTYSSAGLHQQLRTNNTFNMRLLRSRCLFILNIFGFTAFTVYSLWFFSWRRRLRCWLLLSVAAIAATMLPYLSFFEDPEPAPSAFSIRYLIKQLIKEIKETEEKDMIIFCGIIFCFG